MKMISEFKAFAMKGNVIELAIGVVIGAAFGKIISSLIDDVITPLILKPALEAAKITEIDQLVAFGGVKYGVFISSLINFIIVSFVLFLVVKAVNVYKKKNGIEDDQEKKAPTQEELLTEIRDLLKK
jgi:large conductance mechanosensitive channel